MTKREITIERLATVLSNRFLYVYLQGKSNEDFPEDWGSENSIKELLEREIPKED